MDQPPTFTNAAALASPEIYSRAWHEFVRWTVRWLLFFLICLGLGYAGVERYDPRTTAGLSDAAVYYRMVAGEEVHAREMRFRVLVPYVAKPFHALVKRFVDPARAVYVSLLISTSIFCATTTCLLVAIGIRITGNLAVALLAAALYLLNFAIPNFQLAAMIDSGEACFILAVTLTLFGDRWWLLSIWGLLGALAKETFLPLASVLALVWWYVERKRDDRAPRLWSIIAMIIAALATVIGLRLAIAGTWASADLVSQTHATSGAFSGFAGVILSRTFWYVFVWLLPLGLVRLNRLPRPWVLASIFSALTALALGVYRDIGGNVARPIFDVFGPILSLSVAILLTRAAVQTQALSASDQPTIRLSDSE
jgi:hypothetical protein